MANVTTNRLVKILAARGDEALETYQQLSDGLKADVADAIKAIQSAEVFEQRRNKAFATAVSRVMPYVRDAAKGDEVSKWALDGFALVFKASYCVAKACDWSAASKQWSRVRLAASSAIEDGIASDDVAAIAERGTQSKADKAAKGGSAGRTVKAAAFIDPRVLSVLSECRNFLNAVRASDLKTAGERETLRRLQDALPQVITALADKVAEPYDVAA